MPSNQKIRPETWQSGVNCAYWANKRDLRGRVYRFLFLRTNLLKSWMELQGVESLRVEEFGALCLGSSIRCCGSLFNSAGSAQPSELPGSTPLPGLGSPSRLVVQLFQVDFLNNPAILGLRGISLVSSTERGSRDFTCSFVGLCVRRANRRPAVSRTGRESQKSFHRQSRLAFGHRHRKG